MWEICTASNCKCVIDRNNKHHTGSIGAPKEKQWIQELIEPPPTNKSFWGAAVVDRGLATKKYVFYL